MSIHSLLFDPLNINLFQAAAGVIFCLCVGWTVAVAYHYDKVDEVICQLHATDDPQSAPRSLTPVLNALADLFSEHRLLLWRHAISKGQKPTPLHDLQSAAAYVRAYNVLRAYGRAPCTAEVSGNEDVSAPAARERRRAS